jgi:hypothetical protein
MPQITVLRSIASGASVNLFENWQYEYPPKASLLEVLISAEVAGFVMSLTTGTESIVQPESPVGLGALDTLPAPQDFQAIIDKVDPGERLVLTVRNTTGAAKQVQMVANLNFAG